MFNSENEDNYDGLVSLIEASQGVLSLLIVSCEHGDFQSQIINRYEAELSPHIPCYRVVLNQQEPSLRYELEQLVNKNPKLKMPSALAAITVTGTEALLGDEINRFFGYLQWTREGLREFPYPIVLWVTPKILSRLILEAPDFWSWRSGVFRFVPPVVQATGGVEKMGENSLLIESERKESLPLDELLEQMENLEQQGMMTAALATTYNRIAQAYASRMKTRQTEDDAVRSIDFFHKALAIQEKLNLRSAQFDTLLELGNTYRDLGLWTEAFKRYQQSLEIAKSLADPLREAFASVKLGDLYQEYPLGDRASNLENAIASYTAALEVYTRQAFPQNWAMTQNNLGNAYSDRIKGEKADNLELAIASYSAALEVLTRQAFPQKWAMTQNNLGNAYLDRIKREKADNLELAIASYSAALEILTRQAFPQDWAMTQNNLAIAYSDRIKGEKADNLELAIASFTAALEVYTREAFPEKWATTQNNLGNAYLYRIKGEKADNLELAIASYSAALEVRTRQAFPQQWAMTQNNLGNAYRNRIKGEKADNLEIAIASYTAALEVYTRQAFPQNNAETLFNLGLAYRQVPNLQLAYQTFAEAINTVEFLRGEIYSGDEAKQKFAEEWNELYQNMVEVCLELNNYAEAREYADRSKNRNLSDRLSIAP